MSCLTAIDEEIIEVGAEIKNLRLELAPLKERMALIEGRLEEEMARLTALVATGRSEAAASAKTVPEAPPKRKKRPFAGSGTIKDVLDHLKAHPGQEVSPESVAAALAQREKNGLMATCLKRLYEAGMIHRPRSGHYLYLQHAEATMT